MKTKQSILSKIMISHDEADVIKNKIPEFEDIVNRKEFFMLVTKHGNPEVISEKLPIYWHRKNAYQDSIKFGCRVIKVELRWTIQKLKT